MGHALRVRTVLVGRRPLLALAALLVVVASACSLLPGSSEDAPEPLRVTATVLRTANLFVGSEVRVLGLPVGEVTAIEPQGDNVEVAMQLDGERAYPADVNARLTPQSLLGERFVALDPPYTDGPTLVDGDHIPLERTGIPAEVDEVLRSFEEFLSALDGDALAELIDVLSDTLDGNGQGLNELIGSGAQTVRVLSDSSVDLNQLVRDLADLNETLATREERIGSTLVNTAQVLRNLQEDRDLLVASLAELTRAVGELRPIVDEHGDPLVRNLDTLATTLSTVDRNLERLGVGMFGSRRLFTSTQRTIEWEHARLPLDNEAGFLADAANERIAQRLVGVCLRLELPECDTLEELLDALPTLCIPGLCESTGDTPLADGLPPAFAGLSPEAQEAIAQDIQDRVEAEEASATTGPTGTPTPPDPEEGSDTPTPPLLPTPDIRLDGRGSIPGVAADLGLPVLSDDEAGEDG